MKTNPETAKRKLKKLKKKLKRLNRRIESYCSASEGFEHIESNSEVNLHEEDWITDKHECPYELMYEAFEVGREYLDKIIYNLESKQEKVENKIKHYEQFLQTETTSI